MIKRIEQAYKRFKNYYLWSRTKPFYQKYFPEAPEFYKKFSPFMRSGRLGLHKADNRVVVDLERGFLYNRIPKAANTTLMCALFQTYFAEDLTSEELARRAKSFHSVPSELDKKAVEKIDNLFKFTFVRNPYSRTLSAYLDKISRPEKSREYRAKVPQLFKKFGPRPSFYDFCQYLADGGLYANKHWAPQVSLFALPPEKFDLIGKIEKLNQDFEKVLKNLPGLKSPGNPGRVGTTTSASTKIDQHYNTNLLQLIRDLYQEDFNKLNYSPNPP